MSDQTARDLTKRDTFRLITPVTIRFCDTDMLGHVNNVAMASFIEAARCELFYDVLKRAGTDARIDFVLARSAIDFRREVFYPGTIEVGSRFIRLGRSSVTSGYGAFIGDTCVATAECVNVFFDMENRKSIAAEGRLRELIEADLTV